MLRALNASQCGVQDLKTQTKERLLHDIFPKHIADKLMRGDKVVSWWGDFSTWPRWVVG